MDSRFEKNYLINIMLVIIGFACIFTGVALAFKPGVLMPFLTAIKFKSLHEWTGYILTILLGCHLLMHSAWIKMVADKIVKNKKKLVVAVLTVLVSVGICITISTLSPEMKAPNGKSANPGQVQKSN